MKKVNIKKELLSPNFKYLNGRPEGTNARKKLQLDNLESDNDFEGIVFYVDKGLTGINVSYFLGLFSPTVFNNSEEFFKEKYKFEYASDIEKMLFEPDIEEGLKETRRNHNPLKLLNEGEM